MRKTKCPKQTPTTHTREIVFPPVNFDSNFNKELVKLNKVYLSILGRLCS